MTSTSKHIFLLIMVANPLVTKTKFGLDNLNFNVSIHNEDSEADHISSL
jgi:hypothetical protein